MIYQIVLRKFIFDLEQNFKKYILFYFYIKIYFNDNIKNIYNYVYVFKYKMSIVNNFVL